MLECLINHFYNNLSYKNARKDHNKSKTVVKKFSLYSHNVDVTFLLLSWIFNWVFFSIFQYRSVLDLHISMKAGVAAKRKMMLPENLLLPKPSLHQDWEETTMSYGTTITTSIITTIAFPMRTTMPAIMDIHTILIIISITISWGLRDLLPSTLGEKEGNLQSLLVSRAT